MKFAVPTLVALLAATALGVPPGAGSAKFKLLSFLPGEFDNPSEVPIHQSQPVVDRPANRLVYLQRQVRVWVEWNETQDPLGLRICGLTNPDLEFVAGAHVTFTMANTGPTGTSGLLIVPEAAQFTGMLPASRGPWAAFRRIEGRKMDHILAARMRGRIFSATFVYRFETPGRLDYVDPYAWRASAGARGRIFIVP